MTNETETITLRPITDEDLPFLFRVYASTRWEELAPTGWELAQKEEFLRQQFTAQHTWWQAQYEQTSFDIVERGGVPVGRLYVSRWERELRIVDIALLPEFRGEGIGTRLIDAVISEANAAALPVRIHVE